MLAAIQSISAANAAASAAGYHEAALYDDMSAEDILKRAAIDAIDFATASTLVAVTLEGSQEFAATAAKDCVFAAKMSAALSKEVRAAVVKAAVLSKTPQKGKEAHESMLAAAALARGGSFSALQNDEVRQVIAGLELVDGRSIAILKAAACATLSPTAISDMMRLASIYSIISAFQDAAQPPC